MSGTDWHRRLHIKLFRPLHRTLHRSPFRGAVVYTEPACPACQNLKLSGMARADTESFLDAWGVAHNTADRVEDFCGAEARFGHHEGARAAPFEKFYVGPPDGGERSASGDSRAHAPAGLRRPRGAAVNGVRPLRPDAPRGSATDGVSR